MIGYILANWEVWLSVLVICGLLALWTLGAGQGWRGKGDPGG